LIVGKIPEFDECRFSFLGRHFLHGMNAPYEVTEKTRVFSVFGNHAAASFFAAICADNALRYLRLIFMIFYPLDD
jgi:hypothetical protein